MTEERDIKTWNTSSVLQKDNQDPISEEEELLPITKIDKKEKKVIEGRGRGRMRKYLNEKRKSEMVPKPGLPKNTPTKGPKPRRKIL